MIQDTLVDRINVNSEHAQDVLVIGSVAYDDIITPYEHGERLLGGAAAFGAVAASYFVKPYLVGVVGKDFLPEDKAKLESRGIDLSGMEQDDSGLCFYWRGRYHENFNHRETLDIKLNVFKDYTPKLSEKCKEIQYVMLGNIDPTLQLHILNQIKNQPFIIADTIDLWIKTKKEELLKLLKRINLFLINDSEAMLLTGESNVIIAGQKIREYGVDIVIIKKGEHGALLFHEEGLFAMPAYPVTVLRDPTGAGDVFAGAVLGYLAAVNRTDFASLKKAIAYATILAGLTVESFFCYHLIAVGVAGIEERYQELLKYTHF